MNIDVDFDIEDFRERVFSDFVILKAGKMTAEKSPDKFKKNLGKGFWGCLTLPFTLLVYKFGENLLKREIKNRNANEFEREAGELLTQNEIRTTLCQLLKDASRNKILTEENFIKVVVETLADKNLRKQFVIPVETMLFAAVAHQIFETGIDSFCGNLSDEQ